MTSFYGSVNGGQGGGGEGVDTSTLMQKNNPTFNGTITGPNARFTGTVQIPEPTEDNHAATKGYVDATLADVDLSEVTTRMDAIETAQDELAAQLDDKVDAESPAFTGTATLNGKNIATVDQIPNISDLPYLDENNPTYTGTLAGADATFSGVVSVPTPTQDGQAVNKQYVDQAIASVQPEVDLSEVQADIAELQTGKLDKANPTYTGSLTGENAAFSGTVTVATPAAEGEAANKGYVDAAKTELEGNINTLQQTVANQTETINTLNQQVTNITGGTAELPYLKNTGDSGTGVYNFTGATINAADPVDNSNVATKHYVDQKIASAGGTGEVVSYTQGDGISISLENEISLSIDSAGANGLKVGASGLGLDLATDTTSGAMAASDKTAIASNTTEITNIKNGTTELPYLKETNPTYEGTLIGGDATFTGSVQVSTPDQDNEAANKSYVDAIHVQAVADAKNYTDSEIANLESGTTELPYIKNNGDTVTGSYDLTGAAVTIAEPASDNSPATKKYVDDSISTIDVSEQIAPLTERVTAAEGEIDTLQTDVEAVETSVANITNGTTELPYIKDTGDTVTGAYNFTGANVTIAEPTVSNNPATKNYVDTKIASAGGSGEVVSYTQGNGINISPENVISAVVDADNANGLAVDTNGIKLNVATPTTAGAMSGADKAKLDASSTTEQMNQAIEEAVTDLTDGTTELPYVKKSGDTMHGSLTTTELFTDFVTIRNAGTDGKTGFQNNSDTDHIRVYDKVANTLVPIEVGEPVNNQDASTKKYVDDKVTTETAARTEAIESLDEAKADKDNPTFTGIISGANATLSGTLTGNTATFSGGITVPLEPGAEGSATSKKYVDDQIAAIDVSEQIEPLAQRVTTAEGEIDTLQSDITTVKSNVETINTNITNITNGTTKLPYVTKEEVEIAADTRDVARAYRYTFNDGLDGTNSNAGFGFIDFTPAIVTEKDGSTDFSPLYIGEPEKDSQATTKKYVDDAIAAVDAPEYTLAKQGAAEDGYFATYYLTKDGAQVGEKINIPKDYLVKEAELLEVAATDTPYSGAVIGDKYIDFTINTQASDEDEQHIYLPVKDLVDVYTGGNGININASNVVSVQIDAANANGLALGSAGLKLNLATTSAAGAMSAADKTKLDTAISEEQLTAVENEIDTLQTEVNNIKSGTTDLGYLKAANPTYTGTLNGVNATFTGDVIIPTPDGDTEAANKSYVDSAISTAKTEINGKIEDIKDGTTELPYIKDSGDSVTGNYSITGTVTDTASRTSNLQLTNLNTNPDQWIDAEYANIKYNSTNKRVDFSLMTNTGLTTNGVKVSGAEPEGNNDFTTKNYVDTAVSGAKSEASNALSAAKTELEEDIGTVQQTVTGHGESITTLSQAVSDIVDGTTELPYIKNTGDTVGGDYTFNGKVNINQPTDNANATNKQYVDTKDTALDQKISNIVDGTTTLGYIKNTGGTATGTYDFTGATMKVASPSEDKDAATKGYVDENTSPLYTKSSFGVNIIGYPLSESNLGVFVDNVKTESSLYGLTLYGDSSQKHYEGDNLLNPDNITENVGYSDTGASETKQGVFSIKFVFEKGQDYEFNVVSNTITGPSFEDYLSQLNIFYYTAEQSFVQKKEIGFLKSYSIQLINSYTNSAYSGYVYIELTPKEEFALTEEFIINNFVIFPANKYSSAYFEPYTGKNPAPSLVYPIDIMGVEENPVLVDFGQLYTQINSGPSSIDFENLDKIQIPAITSPLYGGYLGNISTYSESPQIIMNSIARASFDSATICNNGEEDCIYYIDKRDYKKGKDIRVFKTLTINPTEVSSYITDGGALGNGHKFILNVNDNVKFENYIYNSFNEKEEKLLVAIPANSFVDLYETYGWRQRIWCNYLQSADYEFINSLVEENPEPTTSYDTIYYDIQKGGDDPNNITISLSNIAIYTTRATTVEEFAAFITAPMQIVYALDEPVETDIPEDELLNLDNIHIKNNSLYTILSEDINEEILNSDTVKIIDFDITYYRVPSSNGDIYPIESLNTLEYLSSIALGASSGNSIEINNIKDKLTILAAGVEKLETLESYSGETYTIDSMKPNTLYNLRKVDLPTITVTAFEQPANTNYVWTYHMIFQSNVTPVTLNLPSSVVYPEDFEIKKKHIYEINIIDNLLSYQSWPME